MKKLRKISVIGVKGRVKIKGKEWSDDLGLHHLVILLAALVVIMASISWPEFAYAGDDGDRTEIVLLNNSGKEVYMEIYRTFPRFQLGSIDAVGGAVLIPGKSISLGKHPPGKYQLRIGEQKINFTTTENQTTVTTTGVI